MVPQQRAGEPLFPPWLAGHSPLSFHWDTFILVLQTPRKTEVIKGVQPGAFYRNRGNRGSRSGGGRRGGSLGKGRTTGVA